MREITREVDLCRGDGRLDPSALGYSRRPLHRANLRGWGRTKRWEYWCVQTPELVLAVTISNLDYAGLHAVWFLDPMGRETGVSRLDPLRGPDLPDRCGGGPVLVQSGSLSVALTPHDAGVRLQVGSPELSADIEVRRPTGHQALGVVVPFSARQFQYTVKENTLPASGHVVAGGARYEIHGEDAWATLDHGRGRWPYRVTWNWGSGSGRVRVDGAQHVLGVQLGGRWTDGTGSVENAITVDGVLHVIDEELDWSYDTGDWLAPWHVRSRASDRVDLTFAPTHDRAERTQLGVLFNDTHQCFGSWRGRLLDDTGRRIDLQGVRGWAEQVRNRW